MVLVTTDRPILDRECTVNLNIDCVDLGTSDRSSLHRYCLVGLVNLDLVGVNLVTTGRPGLYRSC